MIVQVDECKCPGRLDCTEMVPALVANHKKDPIHAVLGAELILVALECRCLVNKYTKYVFSTVPFQIGESFDERRQISTRRMCETAAIHDCSHRKVR